VAENQLNYVREQLQAMRTTEWKAVAQATGVAYGTVYNIAYATRSKDPSYSNVYSLFTHLKAKRKPYEQRRKPRAETIVPAEMHKCLNAEA